MRWIFWGKVWLNERDDEPLEHIEEFESFREMAIYQRAWMKRAHTLKVRVSCIAQPLPEEAWPTSSSAS